ncbi:TetR family transcriptional regulator [Winogradskyella haliclonae]|uniref:TetR family transcriptional regulator n=2 Tax=Winogradskyella haliclonae TaxID=2048558 RepID=A0ABQ2BXJ2_9FLAO|nr:TetR family transcriptional regulator [Winogradskyella haliclonae]
MSIFVEFAYICKMKRALVKQHIIETASNLFYKNGYNRTGINEIIKEANIAKATLYNHFKSKEDICIAYLKYKNQGFTEDLKTFINAKTIGKQKLLGLFDFLQSFYSSKEFNGCWCINTVSEIPKSNVAIRNEIVAQKEALIEFISDLVQDNLKGYTKDESFKIAKQIFILYEGAISESHLQDNPWPIQSAKSICEQLI